ncbi:histidine-type phosphatase [uncultured Desulfovibrio sp.]|uniref:histidine-type phosphatase n=1 Tax=uncultured Desulfovibrio sp. TaxID=167968 RepID=UPI00039E8DC9|nr:histidine-type phosphatase [uncultured Desulfovibrio sp.]
MRTLYLFFFSLVCAVFMASPAGSAVADDGARLLKIVALSRHGVRSPTQELETLSLWSERPWPHWPVECGHLTPRGARLVGAMWTDLRGVLLNYGLLPDAACPPPGAIFVRADTDQRARATARALLNGLAPDCTQGYAAADAKPDPLFHPVKAGLYAFDPAAAAMNVLGMAGGDLARLQEDLAGPLALIDQLIAPPSPDLCSRFDLPLRCRLSDIPPSVSVSPEGRSVDLTGGLGIASSLAEIFLLEYGQWPGSPAGWGQVDGATLNQMLSVHSRVFNVVNRAPLVAWARGSSLLTEMSAALTGTHYDQRLNAASLVVFVGHDTNVAHLGALLGVNWRAKGYPPNYIPPAGVLFLELWGRGDRREVRARFYAQPPEVLHAPFAEEKIPFPGVPHRREDVTGPAQSQDVRSGFLAREGSSADPRLHAPAAAEVSAPPVVGAARFELADFQQLVREKTAGAPLAPQQVPWLHPGREIRK